MNPHAIQLLHAHTKVESTVWYHVMGVVDALEMTEQTEV
jgi:hypothetical protein